MTPHTVPTQCAGCSRRATSRPLAHLRLDNGLRIALCNDCLDKAWQDSRRLERPLRDLCSERFGQR